MLLREHEGSPRYFQHVVSLGNGHGCYWSSCDDMWCRSYLNNNEWSGVCVYVCAHSVLPPLGHRPADRKWVCCRECAAGFLSSSSRSVSAPLALTHSPLVVVSLIHCEVWWTPRPSPPRASTLISVPDAAARRRQPRLGLRASKPTSSQVLYQKSSYYRYFFLTAGLASRLVSGIHVKTPALENGKMLN